MGNLLEESLFKEAEKLSKSISANSNEAELERLCELAVKWILINPEPINLKRVDYER